MIKIPRVTLKENFVEDEDFETQFNRIQAYAVHMPATEFELEQVRQRLHSLKQLILEHFTRENHVTYEVAASLLITQVLRKPQYDAYLILTERLWKLKEFEDDLHEAYREAIIKNT